MMRFQIGTCHAMVSRLLAASALSLLLAPQALAQDGSGWSGGLFALTSSAPYVGSDTVPRAVPNLSYRSERFSIGAQGLAYTAYGDGDDGLDLILTPRFAPYDSSDSAILSGMERSFTVDAGLQFRSVFATGTEFQGRFLQEVTGEHDGQEVDLRLTQSLLDAGLPFAVFAGATWQSAELTEFLYGVRPGEAVAGRPAYAPGNTLTPYIGLGTMIPLSDRTRLLGQVQGRFLGDAITDSPIVGDNHEITAIVGITFDF